MHFLGKRHIITIIYFILISMCVGNLFAQKRITSALNSNYRKIQFVDSAVGYASFYSDKFIGKKTSSGQIFSQNKLTCAHNTLPMGTMIRVTNLENQLSVVVRVNDRLHHRNPRLVDLSVSGAKKLGFRKKGVIKVRVDRINPLQKDNLPKSQ
jgi:rare lipoprotein A